MNVAAQHAAQVSKLLSYWLRHDPAAGGLSLDPQGWAAVSDVLAALERALARPLPLAELEAVVRESDKQRFALVAGRIRANQGHSIPLALDFATVTPPSVLYHGTTRERWEKISAGDGLTKMQRHHVHLSTDIAAARRVATRHRGESPMILLVDAASMVAAGHTFLRSENGVFLAEHVPLAYLTVVPEQQR